MHIKPCEKIDTDTRSLTYNFGEGGVFLEVLVDQDQAVRLKR